MVMVLEKQVLAMQLTKTNKNDILVSVFCIAYNQKKYIKQCLDSLVMQKANFNFEVIIYDDCSTDGTREIIREYADKYPNLIRTILPKCNIAQTEGFCKVNQMIFEKIKGKYHAGCEGDDYWIDEYKLQKQVDFLETHPDYSICFHPVKVMYDGFDFEKTDEIYPTQKMIESGTTFELLLKTNFMCTNSIICRSIFRNTKYEDCVPKDAQPGDWFISLLHAKEGKIKMLPEIMAVYRRHPQGIWSDSIKSFDKLILSWGLHLANFYYSVYKNITNSSQVYLQDMFLPNLKSIINAYYRNKKFKELQTIEERYPTYLNMISLDEKFDERLNKFKTKYKKYKKLSRIALAVIIVQMFVIVAFVV